MNPIRLRGRADILAALPYQLGYHPHDALVVVALRNRAVGLVQRLELPPPEQVDEAVAVLLPALVRDEPDSVLLVGYEEPARPGSSSAVLDALAAACRELEVSVLDRLVVRDGRWFAPDCTGECCPAEGTALPAPEESAAVAEFVALERAPVPDRAALANQLEPDPARTRAVGSVLATVRRRHHGARVGRLECLSLWALVGDVSAGRPPLEGLSAEELAVLALSLRDLGLRDGLIAWLCPGFLPPDALDADLRSLLETALPEQAWSASPATAESSIAGRRLQARLALLCRAMPREEAAPILTVLANLTWWLGDGATTRLALERALEAEPDYRLAQLLDRMVDLAIRPRQSA